MPRKYRRFLSFIIIVAKISKHKYRIQLFKAIIPFVKEELTCLINLLESGEFDENIQIVNSTWKHALLKTLGTTYIVTSCIVMTTSSTHSLLAVTRIYFQNLAILKYLLRN